MQNFDITSLLPLLMNGNNGDLNSILSAMGKVPPPPSSPPPPPPGPTGTNVGGKPPFPNYDKLYPRGTPIGDMPKTDAPPRSAPSGGTPDMATLLQLMAAMNARKQTAAPKEPDIAPTATKEIRDSLRTILSLNALDETKKDSPD